MRKGASRADEGRWLLFAFCLLFASSVLPAPALAEPPTIPRVALLNQAPLEPATGTLFGAYVDSDGRWTNNNDQFADILTYESLIGRHLDVVNHYYSWTDTFPSGLEQWDIQGGRTPLITWEPWNTTLADIASPRYDVLIRTRAREVANLKPALVFLRWGHEMNGNWYPWSGSQNGGANGGPAAYVAAYQHIHDLFVQEGATNVAWVWCFNADDAPTDAWNHWANYYPGDNYVDWVGIDGFNWGNTRTWSTWKSLATIIGPGYGEYYNRKPIMIAETGSTERGGDKAQWFSEARTALQNNFPDVKALVYFHHPQDPDWRMTTSARAGSAYRAMGEGPYFHGSAPPASPGGGAFVWPQSVRGDTQVAFTLFTNASVSVEIRNSQGVAVRHLLASAPFAPGTFMVKWDRKDDTRHKTPGGTYTAVVFMTDGVNSSQSSQSFQAT